LYDIFYSRIKSKFITRCQDIR